MATPPEPVRDAWFEQPVCRNCDAALHAPYCPACGQKAARRFAWRDLGREGWERLRVFELAAPRTIRRLVLQPGTIAREYVLGRRTVHMHPLKLLLVLVALLVLVLAASRYFEVYGFAGRNAEVDRMAQRVMGYANWSFSLGIVAIFLGSWLGFHGRLGYNAIEHAVLAVYAQSIILAAIIVNLLPTLVWRDPAFVLGHKAASQYYMVALKLLIVAVAYKQFFVVDLRREWPRLAAACLLYTIFAWLLLRFYAAAILWLVR